MNGFHRVSTAAALLVAVSSGYGAEPPSGSEGPVAARVEHASRALLLDAAMAGDRIVGVGDHSIIITSDDLGKSWSQATVPLNGTLTAVSFADEREGWAAGHGATLLHSMDGGLSWERVPTPVGEDESFLDLLALAPGRLLAVGAYGVFLETRDAGLSWEQRHPIEDDWHLNRISQGASGRLYLAGESGTPRLVGRRGLHLGADRAPLRRFLLRPHRT